MSNSQLIMPLFSVGKTLHFLLLNEFLGIKRKNSASLHLSVEGQESLYRKRFLYGGTEMFPWPGPHPLEFPKYESRSTHLFVCVS